MKGRLIAVLAIVVLVVVLFSGTIQNLVNLYFPPFVVVVAGIPLDLRTLLVFALPIGVAWIAYKAISMLGRYALFGRGR